MISEEASINNETKPSAQIARVSRGAGKAGRSYRCFAQEQLTSADAENKLQRFPVVLRVSDAGQRHRRDIHQWPASESRQGKNPRGMGRGECRALRYGDLADAEGVSAGAPCRLRRFVTWQAGGDRSG